MEGTMGISAMHVSCITQPDCSKYLHRNILLDNSLFMLSFHHLCYCLTLSDSKQNSAFNSENGTVTFDKLLLNKFSLNLRQTARK